MNAGHMYCITEGEFTERVQRAINYCLLSDPVRPTHCHARVVPDGIEKINGVVMVEGPDITPDHFWLGVEYDIEQ